VGRSLDRKNPVSASLESSGKKAASSMRLQNGVGPAQG
jgi:hypothetical protein